MKIADRASVFLAMLALIPGTASADPIDDLVAADMARTQTPGVAIAVIDRGRVARIQGFGEANIEHRVPVHPDTMFKAGATGMQFTAATIMLLVEDGRIDLDAPVTRFLAKAPAKWGKVTIRHLLDHTSGLPATPNGDFRADYTNAQLLEIIAGQDINFAPGARWRFSYAGYIMLGFVIEEVTGKHWSQVMAERVFAPLGMKTARGIDEMAIVPNRANGYELREKGLRNAEWISPTANSTADGSLYVSVLDYAAWAQAVSDRRLLTERSWTALSQGAKLQNRAACPHVPGWSAGGSAAHPAWTQSGSWQGFQTYTLRFPARDLTIAVYANGEKANVRSLAHTIAGLTDPALAQTPASPRTDADAAATARARLLIEAVAAGRADPADYADFATLDFTEMTALFAGTLADLGPLTDFALFDRAQQCGEDALRYRARSANGVVEIRLGLTGTGKVASLDVAPLIAWNEPL